MANEKMKGQVEAIFMTLIFLVVVLGLILFALFQIVMLHGQQKEGVVSFVGGALDAWASEAMLADAAGERSVMEVMLQTAAVNATEAAQTKPAETSLKGAISAFGIKTYDITWSNTQRKRIGWMTSAAKFCGDLKSADKSYAYCERTCSDGRVENTVWKERCGEERCCVEQYDFDKKKYVNVPIKPTWLCGPDSVGFYGLCEVWSCTAGRIQITKESGSMCPFGWMRMTVCCRPASEAELRAMVQEEGSNVVVPLFYNGIAGQASFTFGAFGLGR